MDLKEFIAALTADWVSLMSGIASVVLTAIGLARRWDSVPRYALWAAAVICFLLAAARVWTTEHRARLAVEQQLTRLTVPKFEGSINLISAGPAGERDEHTLLGVFGSIKNTGAPSIAQEFHVVVTTAAGKAIEGEVFPPPRGAIILGGVTPDEKLVVPGEEFFPRKAIQSPIPTGGAVTGYILMLVRGINQDELRKGAVIRMSFQDVRGTLYSCTRTLNDVTFHPLLNPEQWQKRAKP